jgi:hypothetical protein
MTPDRRLTAASRLILSLLAVGVFFLLRSHFLNADGAAFPAKFIRDIPWLGAHVTHDEMWELYAHSRFWLYTHRWMGLSVEFSYQLLSCLAGGVFVYLLLTYAATLSSDRRSTALLLCVSGGYMQLFFGDVENYTLTTTWIMAYLLASTQYLRHRSSVVLPAALLAISITFHLLAGFLVPSLLYLMWVARRRGENRPLCYAAAAFVLIIAATLAFFDVTSRPLSYLWSSSHVCGNGGHIRSMLAIPSGRYYFDMTNLACLLAPAWILILPLLFWKRVPADSVNTHLALASIGMVVFLLGWRAGLGPINDWNLFAPVALPVSLLVCRGDA